MADAAKKKLIRVEFANHVNSNNVYRNALGSGLYFAFINDVEIVRDGVKYKQQVSRFITCREQLCEIPRSFLHKKHCNDDFDETKQHIDMNNLRLLMGTNDADKKAGIFSAKRIINILEEKAKWTTSVITTIKHKDMENNTYCWLLTGPEQWIRVPQMLSLICLILRLGWKYGPFNVESMKDVNKVFKNLASDIGTDNTYIGVVRNHITTLMKKIDLVFDDKQERYYTDPYNNEDGWIGHGGIDTLCKCSTGNEQLNENMKKYIFA